MSRLRGRGFFFVAGVLWLAMVLFLPSVQPAARTLLAAPLTDDAPPSGVTVDPVTGAPAAAAPGGASAPTAARGGAAAAGGVAAVGKTRGGIECRPGVLQVPDSAYAPPCRPKFTGDNGGATWNGVTATEIHIADRYFGPNILNSAGGAPTPDSQAVVDLFLKYFNDNFELYGRRVVVDEYRSPHGDEIAEGEGQGRDAACEDAITLSQEHHDFAVVFSGSPVFADCASRYGLVVTDAQGKLSEPFLRERDPYLWTTEQECYRFAYQIAEWLGKRVAFHPARYAGSAEYRAKTRKFGVFLPDDEIFGPCLALVKKEAARYGITDISQFDFRPDPSSLSEQASRAVVKFKAEGVTSIVMACDIYSYKFLTEAARNQDWHPEWINIGTGGTDTDGNGRTYESSEVAGHMFGRSEFVDDSHYFGPESEGAALYRKLTHKEYTVPGGFVSMVQLFRLLQAAGPNLTPYTLAAGARALPTASGPLGIWSYRFNPDGSPGVGHGATLDANEIYWEADAISVNDGKRGRWKVNRARYGFNQWPIGPPDVYPGL